MNSKKNFLPLILFFFTAGFLFSGGGKENTEPPIQITGRVRLVGNEPFRELVISTQNGEWYVAREEEHKLIEYQHKTVTVEGNETIKELTFAGGQSAGKRKTLSNIKVILIE